MDYFTSKYKAITNVVDVPFSMTIQHDEPNRWICYQHREKCGQRYEYTLIDNYLEKYVFYWDGKGITDFTTLSGDKFDTTISIETNKIVCRKYKFDNLPLPDFVIDVLQTIDSNIFGIEIIRRIVENFHKVNHTVKIHKYITDEY